MAEEGGRAPEDPNRDAPMLSEAGKRGPDGQEDAGARKRHDATARQSPADNNSNNPPHGGWGASQQGHGWSSTRPRDEPSGGGGWGANNTGYQPPSAASGWPQRGQTGSHAPSMAPSSPAYSTFGDDQETPYASSLGKAPYAPPDLKKLPAWLLVRLTREETKSSIDNASVAHSVRALLTRLNIEYPPGQIRIERDGPRAVLLLLTEYAVRELIDVKKITVMDVTTLNADGSFHSNAEAQLQMKTQAAYEKGETASHRAQGIPVFGVVARQFTSHLLQKELFNAVVSPKGFQLIGLPHWSGGDGTAQTTSNQIRFHVATPGMEPFEAPWAKLRQLAIPTVLGTDPISGQVSTGGHKVMVTCSVSKDTAAMLQVCKDCLRSIETGCSPLCVHFKRPEVRPPPPPRTKYVTYQEQHKVAAQGLATEECNDWLAGRPCRRGGTNYCPRTHPDEKRGLCYFFLNKGNCTNPKCPYPHQPPPPPAGAAGQAAMPASEGM